MTVKENFVNYRKFRWLWITILMFGMFVLLYVFNNSLDRPRGSTTLGYIYGGLATFFIFYLMWYGIRKRSYTFYATPLVGWLSAHVWIGILLIVIVPLHSGFEFGPNVSTLAYGLLLGTIVTGFWGAFNYLLLPKEIISQHGGMSVRDLIGRIHHTDDEISFLETDKSDAFEGMLYSLDEPFKPSFRQLVFSKETPSFIEDLDQLNLSSLPRNEVDAAIQASNLIKEKKILINKLRHEMKTHFSLNFWLYFHIPLAFSLCIAVAIHLFSVFYFR